MVPVKQEYAITGSLSVRGDVLPVGGVSAKVEAALEAGIKKVIVPESNLRDIVIDDKRLAKISVVPVKSFTDVLRDVLDWTGKEEVLKRLTMARPGVVK